MREVFLYSVEEDYIGERLMKAGDEQELNKGMLRFLKILDRNIIWRGWRWWCY